MNNTTTNDPIKRFLHQPLFSHKDTDAVTYHHATSFNTPTKCRCELAQGISRAYILVICLPRGGKNTQYTTTILTIASTVCALYSCGCSLTVRLRKHLICCFLYNRAAIRSTHYLHTQLSPQTSHSTPTQNRNTLMLAIHMWVGFTAPA